MNQRAQEIRGQVVRLLEPILTEEDLVLFDVKVVKSGGRTSIELAIDKPEGGLDLNTLGLINRRLRLLLEEAGVAPEGFAFWVSTPGVDRPLKEAKDFRRVKGRMIEIWVQDEATQTVTGPFTGVVGDVQEGAVLLMRTDECGGNGGLLKVALDRIVKAQQKI